MANFGYFLAVAYLCGAGVGATLIWISNGESEQKKMACREREWTDETGTHYEAQAIGRDGKIYSQKVTKLPMIGWPAQRERAMRNVLAAAAAASTT